MSIFQTDHAYRLDSGTGIGVCELEEGDRDEKRGGRHRLRVEEGRHFPFIYCSVLLGTSKWNFEISYMKLLKLTEMTHFCKSLKNDFSQVDFSIFYLLMDL